MKLILHFTLTFFFLIIKILSSFNVNRIRLISIIILESEKNFGFSKMKFLLQEKKYNWWSKNIN